MASFKYHFKFGEDEVIYSYDKKSARKIVMESLDINGVNYVKIDRRVSNVAKIEIPGTENLNNDFTEARYRHD